MSWSLAAEILVALSLILLGNASVINITLDDHSPQIIYPALLSSESRILCPSETSLSCSESFASQLFNGTSTTTTALVVVPFTGSAVYVTLWGQWRCHVCDINHVVPALALTNLSEGPHVLTMRGSANDSAVPIQLDFLIYTQNMESISGHLSRSARIGAIVGGVLGGLALIAASLFLGAISLRKRAQGKRRGSRALWLRQEWAERPSGIVMEGVEANTHK
ncbi:hypothetical protein MIND_00616800 [Mycena indigotica]|uniref:Uncharacterized protein n=1 Tax=Mycena indigotica TaxID=2126181 RepID=A0A8H6SQC5_9AGAR|nr:uncharacterized protein MIND_00616800 [Mycena indigotica]KAF7303868.1 hypothetical protein MIND_00616800 [Mycena indigotica]